MWYFCALCSKISVFVADQCCGSVESKGWKWQARILRSCTSKDSVLNEYTSTARRPFVILRLDSRTKRCFDMFGCFECLQNCYSTKTVWFRIRMNILQDTQSGTVLCYVREFGQTGAQKINMTRNTQDIEVWDFGLYTVHLKVNRPRTQNVNNIVLCVAPPFEFSIALRFSRTTVTLIDLRLLNACSTTKSSLKLKQVKLQRWQLSLCCVDSKVVVGSFNLTRFSTPSFCTFLFMICRLSIPHYIQKCFKNGIDASLDPVVVAFHAGHAVGRQSFCGDEAECSLSIQVWFYWTFVEYGTDQRICRNAVLPIDIRSVDHPVWASSLVFSTPQVDSRC